MRYQRSQKGRKLLMKIGLLTILLAGLIILLLYLYRNNKANLLNRGVVFFSKYKSLSPFIFAQARLESGNFNSNLYRALNNAFGMGHAVKRKQLGERSSSRELNGKIDLQKYRNDTQSLRDLFLWMDYTKFPVRVTGADQYVRELKNRNYFESKESDYLKGLNVYLK